MAAHDGRPWCTTDAQYLVEESMMMLGGNQAMIDAQEERTFQQKFGRC